MNRIKKNASWIIVVAGLVVGSVFLHMEGSSLNNATSNRMKAKQEIQRSDTLANRMNAKVSSVGKKAGKVSEITALTLSGIHKSAPSNGITLSRITILGHTQSNRNGLQNLASAAKAAHKLPGLKQISLRISGSWSSLKGLKHFFEQFKTRPVRIEKMTITQGFFKMELKVYGIQ